ncbi:dolichyl-P-Man:Man5GlcNAc2-PP-dolichol alpha-1,3-mannosyltransferase [Sarracenia purpurea var. burkii]
MKNRRRTWSSMTGGQEVSGTAKDLGLGVLARPSPYAATLRVRLLLGISQHRSNVAYGLAGPVGWQMFAGPIIREDVAQEVGDDGGVAPRRQGGCESSGGYPMSDLRQWRHSKLLQVPTVESRSGEEDMAVRPRPATEDESIHRKPTSALKLFENPKVGFAFVLLFIDVLLVSLIIAYVPYTKIDWDAYMSQVHGFLEGERDYRNLNGDTGPLVYPAGFLYIYSAMQFLTGGQVYPAQILFGILYISNLAIVLFIYVKTDVDTHLRITLKTAIMVRNNSKNNLMTDYKNVKRPSHLKS